MSSRDNLRFKWKTEGEFSRYFVSTLRKFGAFVQRIESGRTGRGIPDMYIIIGNHSYWIELKRVKHDASMFDPEHIPWRPGQERWLYDVEQRGQRGITIVCFDDILYCVRHDCIHSDNLVNIDTFNGKSFTGVYPLIHWLKNGGKYYYQHEFS